MAGVNVVVVGPDETWDEHATMSNALRAARHLFNLTLTMTSCRGAS